MAPRKRTTRQRKNDPKKAKLDAFLQDFDSEVESRVVRMKEKINQLLKDMDNSANMALLKLPMSVREMNWLEYFKSEKPASPEVTNPKKEAEAASIDSVMAEDHAVLLKSVKKTSKKSVAAKSSSDDENVPARTRKGRTAKKPATTKRAKAMGVCNQNASVRRSNRKPLVTPARNMMDCSLLLGSTPLITPRFDPRLPRTAVRVPRHKERVYSMSVNGSPISAANDDIVISIPSRNGESLQLLASQMDSVDVSLLDQTALKSIRLLQNRLTTLCGIAE
ncbi:borealin [Nelusetta ayraudi]|uniref:borealin n=1 Tax=Nelusetta ayraudi TaxID=303726 RepID=UPI003F716799